MGTGLARDARQRAGRRAGPLRRQANPLKSVLDALALVRKSRLSGPNAALWTDRPML
jgi:hypothetical protein